MSSSLKSVSTNSGFLQDCPVEFVHGLNCIIGARGTCKSTLVESIRFAFNHDPSRVAELLKSRPTEPDGDRSDAHLGLVRATLGAGSIRCEIEESESALLVEREVDGDPRVFVEGVREHHLPKNLPCDRQTKLLEAVPTEVVKIVHSLLADPPDSRA